MKCFPLKISIHDNETRDTSLSCNKHHVIIFVAATNYSSHFLVSYIRLGFFPLNKHFRNKLVFRIFSCYLCNYEVDVQKLFPKDILERERMGSGAYFLPLQQENAFRGAQMYMKYIIVHLSWVCQINPDIKSLLSTSYTLSWLDSGESR